MRVIGVVLFCASALLLTLGALLERSAGLAAAALVVAGCFAAVVYWFRTELFYDLCLLAACILCAFTPFVGVSYLFAVPSVVLALFGWNSVRQFSHFDSAPASRAAKQQHYIRYSVVALVPTIAITGLVAIALRVRISLSFGPAILITAMAVATVFIFLRVAGEKRDRNTE